MKGSRSLVIALLLTGIILAACQGSSGLPPRTPTAAPTATQRTPAQIATLAATRPPAVTPTITPANDGITLTWWTPEFLSPKASEPAGPLMGKYVAQFEAARSDKVRIHTVLKARYGKGGLLDYLRTTQGAAPSLLPDIIALDMAEIEQAASLGILAPLDSAPLREISPTLYAFARQTGHIDGRFLAMPLVADFDHAVFNRERVGQPPATWAGLLAEKVSYAFPVGLPEPSAISSPADDVPAVFLAQYISAGGAFDTKTRRLTLQEQPLQRVLTYYRDARETNLLPANIASITTPDQAWDTYQQSTVSAGAISARRFLTNREAFTNTIWAAAPGWSNPAAPIGSGWALAITTADPARQKIAADFIAWLLAPERAGPYAQAIGWLPTSPAALATWSASPYTEFLGSQLTVALPRPAGPDYAQTAARLRRAVTAVLKGASSPLEAAQAALKERP